VANGIQYSHRPQDLIFIDRSCIVANVGSAVSSGYVLLSLSIFILIRVQDDGIEALTVPFNTIDTIEITREGNLLSCTLGTISINPTFMFADKSVLNVRVMLSSPPRLQGTLMATPKGTKFSTLVFDIHLSEEKCMTSALLARQLVRE
jgi:hypothetical protein